MNSPAGACLLTLVLMAGCSEPAQMPTPDQCLRSTLFQACMKSLPAGPQSTQYNDWDDVVDSCASAAYYQSLRPKAQITEQCRADNR